MQILLLDPDTARQDRLMLAFLGAGFRITATGSAAVAECWLETSVADMLIAVDAIDAEPTHPVARFAHAGNPRIATLVISDRRAAAAEDLLLDYPGSLGVVDPRVPAEVIVQLARASVLHMPLTAFVRGTAPLVRGDGRPPASPRQVEFVHAA